MEYTLGNVAATSASMSIYNYWANGDPNRFVTGWIYIRGTNDPAYDFAEGAGNTYPGTPSPFNDGTFSYSAVDFNNPPDPLPVPVSNPNAGGGWQDLGTAAEVWGDGAGAETGWFDFDITDFYNANLGETVTLSIRFVNRYSNSTEGPIFEDRENGAWVNRAVVRGTAELENSGPRITVEPVPEPASLALVLLGGMLPLLGRRSRR
jgi:hypothetical protein